MEYRIFVQSDPPYRRWGDRLEGVAIAALQHAGAKPGELTLVLASEKRIRQLNRRFAGVDEPTDVLAFADGSVSPESHQAYHGDVVIAVPVAQSQAHQAGHALERELDLLVVHGVLHLVGYDHADDAGEARMRSAQAQILSGLGHPAEGTEGQ